MITCRRQAEQAGFSCGYNAAPLKRAHARVAADEEAAGKGSNAHAVPLRWREVFRKAYFRAAIKRRVGPRDST